MRRHVLALLVGVFALALLPRAASAQFDTPDRSFHNATAFRLDGKHQTVACESCHVNGQYKGTPNTCYDCHWIRRRDDRFQTRLGAQCEQCHRPTSWTAVRWDHASQSGVPLNQNHRQIACESCHRGATFRGASVTCVNCHQKDYSATRSPNHAAAGFPATCDSCHRPSESTWRNTGTGTFSHNAVFPLVGMHATQTCIACHKNNVYKGLPNDCVGCHQADYNRTQTPNHVAAGFPLSCDACHRATDSSFKGSGAATSFNHNSVFALVGLHGTQNCTACHKNNVFKGTPRECIGCHQNEYNRTQTPNHVAAGFSTSCETCHRSSDTSWVTGAGFNHNAVYALVGVHASQACTVCHRNSIYKGTARDCIGCHQAQYNATRSPSHAAAGFGTTCDSCHRPTDPQWTGASFNHNNVFSLVGRHTTTACASCHVNNVYKGTARDCIGCHQAQYNATRSPSHAAAGFGTTCDSCHRPTDPQWTGASFNHNNVFSLVGRHTTTACASCHVNNVYKGTARDCIGCHQTQYNATKSPPHASAGFGTTCDSCHRPTDPQWTGVNFNHNSVFSLVGKHATTACASCHVNNVFKGTRRDCIGCHQTQYNATKSPPHASAGFGTTCDSCHRPTDAQWAGANFNHNSVFSLVGKHATTACASCHVNNVFKGTRRDCVGCHQTQYNATRNPPHASAGFGTTCDSCHRPTDAQWAGANFNHNTVFSLVGNHATAACASCHVNNVFKGTARTCVGCHQAKYNATTNPKHSTAGFGTTCDTCHKATDSSWQQGKFSHTRFPLTGHHNVSCAQCHTTPNNYAVFSCTVCHGRSETDSHHRNRNGYVYESNACYSCHPNGKGD